MYVTCFTAHTGRIAVDVVDMWHPKQIVKHMQKSMGNDFTRNIIERQAIHQDAFIVGTMSILIRMLRHHAIAQARLAVMGAFAKKKQKAI